MKSELERRLTTYLLTKVELGKKSLAVHTNGDLTNDWAPEIRRIQRADSDYRLSVMSKYARAMLYGIGKFREDHGQEKCQKLTNLIDQIQVSLITRDGKVTEHTGIAGKVGEKVVPLKPILDDINIKAAFETLIELHQNMKTELKNSFFCPTSFCYEPNYIDTTNLDKLLDEEKYKPNERRPNSLRSSNAKLKSEDNLHKVNVSYTLGEENGKFYIDVKYFAFGLNKNGKRDKFDLVVRLDENGDLANIYHVECNLPVTIGLLNIGAIKGLKKGVIDIESMMNIEDGWTGFEYKTQVQDNICYGSSFYFDRAERDDVDPNALENLHNYQQLLDDPSLLGGYCLAEVIDHVRDNMDQLKSIYHNKND